MLYLETGPWLCFQIRSKCLNEGLNIPNPFLIIIASKKYNKLKKIKCHKKDTKTELSTKETRSEPFKEQKELQN